MEYRRLGRTGTRVSNLCLGAMTFGEPTESSFMHGIAASSETSWAMMGRALDAGVNFIDTADVYGNDGLSERVIGEWFVRNGRRTDWVLATKCRFRMHQGPLGSGGEPTPHHAGLRGEPATPAHRLHRPSTRSTCRTKTPRRKKSCGRSTIWFIRVRSSTPGAATTRPTGSCRPTGLPDKRNLHPFATLQAEYSLVVRSLEREHIPYMERSGMGLLPWSPLAGGLLSGKYHRGEDAPVGTRLAKWQDRLKGSRRRRSQLAHRGDPAPRGVRAEHYPGGRCVGLGARPPRREFGDHRGCAASSSSTTTSRRRRFCCPPKPAPVSTPSARCRWITRTRSFRASTAPGDPGPPSPSPSPTRGWACTSTTRTARSGVRTATSTSSNRAPRVARMRATGRPCWRSWPCGRRRTPAAHRP
jgi:aryl-alcohol dehydrogenase-like predicted oxidoreductase